MTHAEALAKAKEIFKEDGVGFVSRKEINLLENVSFIKNYKCKIGCQLSPAQGWRLATKL